MKSGDLSSPLCSTIASRSPKLAEKSAIVRNELSIACKDESCEFSKRTRG